MDETYRMLGREHEADLEREAQKFRRADAVRSSRRTITATPRTDGQRLLPTRIVTLLLRAARAES